MGVRNAGGLPVPTVLREGPYRFFFYAGDRNEPMHVHVERDDKVAKFWLNPVRFQSSEGFTRAELDRIHELVKKHKKRLQEAWNAYFNG